MIKFEVIDLRGICENLSLNYIMNSDEDIPSDEVDSGNVSSGDDVEFPMEVECNTSREKQNEVEEYPFEVLSTEQIVQHMVETIKDVNSVIQVSVSFLSPFFLTDVNFLRQLSKIGIRMDVTLLFISGTRHAFK